MFKKQVTERKAPQPQAQGRTRNPAGVSRLGGCVGMWEGHLRALLRCGAVWGEVGQGQFAVNMVERDRQAVRFRELNDSPSSFRRHGLSGFIVGDVPLCAADARGHSLLGGTDARANGFDGMHKHNYQRRLFQCQQVALFIAYLPR